MTFINIFCFSEKIRLDVSSDSSARQRSHMKNQALFSSKDKIKMSSVAIFLGALRVNNVVTGMAKNLV